MKYTLLTITVAIVSLAAVEAVPTHSTNLGTSAGGFFDNYAHHSVPKGSLQVFTSKQNALLHCEKDPLVWLDMRTDTAYPVSSPQFGHTAKGGYACKHESLAAGNREAPSGHDEMASPPPSVAP